MWTFVLVLIAILVIVLFRSSREGMTNKDLLDTLKTFGDKGTKPSKDIHQEAIYGPKTSKVEEPKPAPSGKNGDSDANVYPDIYGPEITPIPGSKVTKKGGKNESDSVTDEAYQFNPDFSNAFPREENEPQPFLTDFSSFQH